MDNRAARCANTPNETICPTWQKCLSSYFDICNWKHLCSISTCTEKHTLSMVGCWVSKRLLVDEIRGVPFISSPSFSWSANSSVCASHLAVTTRQWSDSELREETGRMQTKVKHPNICSENGAWNQVHIGSLRRSKSRRARRRRLSKCQKLEEEFKCGCVWWLVRQGRASWMVGERMTIRETDNEDEGATVIWVSRSVAVSHFHPHLETSLSPHAITLSPDVRSTPSPRPLATEHVSRLSCGQSHLWPSASLIHATEKRAEAQEGGQLFPDMPISLDRRPPQMPREL